MENIFKFISIITYMPYQIKCIYIYLFVSKNLYAAAAVGHNLSFSLFVWHKKL